LKANDFDQMAVLRCEEYRRTSEKKLSEHLWGQMFEDDNEVEQAVQSWLKVMPKSIFLDGNRKLVDRWTK
jgi:hypothetical protein